MVDVAVTVESEMVQVDQVVVLPPADMMQKIDFSNLFGDENISFGDESWVFGG